MLTNAELEEIKNAGADCSVVEEQVKLFVSGFPFLKLKAPAIVGAGILSLNESERSSLAAKYDAFRGKRVKFVPASGAATRMFKSLYEAKAMLDAGELSPDVLDKYKEVRSVFEGIGKFAFYGELKEVTAKRGVNLDCLAEGDHSVVLSLILGEEGLSYGSLPKGLIKFHSYGSEARTAITEHLVEGAEYAKDENGSVFIHFTVSPSHLEGFKAEVAAAKSAVEARYGVKISTDYSVQKQSTDTIAVNPDNTLFRDNDGKLVFRPAGHGALLENLNDIDGDIIFIKNIDNVVPDSLKPATVEYKKVLAGLLVGYQERLFAILSDLDKGFVDSKVLEAAANLYQELGGDVSHVQSLDDTRKAEYYKHFFNRPIRVCGMVKNQGEPGGGPFYALNADGDYSLQIVESSQIDLADASQKSIFDASTHFNPVDLVCGVRSYKGSKFDLKLFRDSKAGFISSKSKDGKELKAMELPGLWNGAMSSWITLFVEVPLETFNPVKTIGDLLRNEHQS